MAEKEQVHYIHRLNYSARERLVGIFVLVAIGLLFTTLAFNKQTARLFAQKFVLHANITNAEGISTDTHVFVSGVDVGNVTALGLTTDNKIAVTMQVLERFHRLIRTDSTAEISKLSVIGNSAIDIKPGSPDKPMIENDAYLMLTEPMSVDQLMGQVSPVLQDVKGTIAQLNQVSHSVNPNDVDVIMKNLAQVTENLKIVTGQFSSEQGTATTNAALQSLAATLKQTQELVADMRPLIKNANAASADMPELLAQSRKLVTQLNVTMGTVNYQLQALPDLVTRTRQILDQTDATLQAIQNTWPISAAVAKQPDNTLTPVQPPP